MPSVPRAVGARSFSIANAAARSLARHPKMRRDKIIRHRLKSQLASFARTLPDSAEYGLFDPFVVPLLYERDAESAQMAQCICDKLLYLLGK
jgi:hypothetical protein